MVDKKEIAKIGFKDLKWYLQVATIGGFCYMGLLVIGFIIGFIDGYYYGY